MVRFSWYFHLILGGSSRYGSFILKDYVCIVILKDRQMSKTIDWSILWLLLNRHTQRDISVLNRRVGAIEFPYKVFN